VAESLINKVDGQPGTSLFVGMPPPEVIREMQIAREGITIRAYLLLAETGLMSILAHAVTNKKFERFRAVEKKYATMFFQAVKPIEGLSQYKGSDLFPWVSPEGDRVTCKRLLKNIVAALELIELLRKATASPAG